MSEYKKDELNTQLSKLTADRDVLRWKALQPNSPTIENYETQEKYVTNEKNFALDDIVNGIGNGSLVQGTEQWYAAHKKVSDFDNQLRALNMGKMGQLDGERAVTAEEQAREEKDEEESSNSVVNFFDGIFDTVRDTGKSVVDSVTGGIEWVEENGEAIGAFVSEARKAKEAEKKELMDSLEGDYAQIAPALDSMINILDEQGDRETQKYVEELFGGMLNGEELNKLVTGVQTTLQNAAFGNKVYATDFNHDNMRAQMEVLTHGTINTFNQGTTLDELAMDFAGLFIPSGETDIYTDLTMYALEDMVDSLKEQNNPGRILQDGDVRICIQPLDGLVNTQYFFRDSEFLYSINEETSVIEYGENYDSILSQMIQDSINQLSE